MSSGKGIPDAFGGDLRFTKVMVLICDVKSQTVG
jgi:hypothetical protein